MTGFETIPASYVTREKRTFLRIAQSNSRAAMQGSDEYIEGLRPGQFFTNTGVALSDTIEAIMLKFYVSIQVRENAMVMAKNVATLSMEEFDRIAPSLIKTEGGYWLDKSGHKYEEQANFVVLLPQYPELGAMILPLKSSELSMARYWIQLAMKVQNPNVQNEIAPMWSSLWRIKTKLETKQDKKSGRKFTYYVIDTITRVGWIKKEIVAEVQDIFNEVQSTPVQYTPLPLGNDTPAIEQVQPVASLPDTSIGKAVQTVMNTIPSTPVTDGFDDDIPF